MIRRLFLCILFFTLLYPYCNTQATSWQSSESVWNFGLILNCDKGLNKSPEEYFKKGKFDPSAYENISMGDVVWVESRFVKSFNRYILPTIRNPFILVISEGDESFPSNSKLLNHLDAFINHGNIIHIFAQNCDYRASSHKVSHLPIGVDFHTQAYKVKEELRIPPSEQEAQLKQILQQLKPTGERKTRAFVDFQHNNTMKESFHRDKECGEDRIRIFEQLKKTSLIDYSERLPRSELWRTKGEYAFSISPHGNGLDCHRTWEDLILGCIVIVKTSPLDPLYEGLPVVIVKEWSEVTKENLVKWQEQYKDAFTNPSYRAKLTNAYWLTKIRQAR